MKKFSRNKISPIIISEKVLLSFKRKKQEAPYNDCFFKNIKKNHNDDGVIVWYNVGQSGGNKG